MINSGIYLENKSSLLIRPERSLELISVLCVLNRLRRDREVERLMDYQEVEFLLKPEPPQVSNPTAPPPNYTMIIES